MRVRWRIFALLFGFGLLAYVQQKSLTIAAEQMMPQLGLSQMQVGWLQQAFVLGYAILQLPGGLFGQRQGARRTFVIIGVVSFIAMIATPVAPYLFGGQPLFVFLLGAQLMLGFSQAAIFPVCAGVWETWFPANRWAFVVGLHTMGTALGAAITPPLIASLMIVAGWQKALLWTTLPALGLIVGWAWYGRNTPREHPSVTPAELAEIGDDSIAQVHSDISLKRLLGLLTNRNVLLLTISYVLMNYAFYLLSNWSFLYLVQERHFSVLASGWLAISPPLASAIGAGLGGVLTGALCKRYGNRWGFRLIPLFALPVAGLLLMVVVGVANPYLAVLALALCFGCVELTEGSFWGGAISVARGDSMTVCGILNTGGNLGGIIGIPIVAYLSGRGSWHAAFLIGTGFALASAVAWLGIDAGQTLNAD
jgi:ACS family glucarate transporter-like MFS transporter